MATEISTSLSYSSGLDGEGFQPYRALSVTAVTSLILALLSVLTFFHWALGLIPMLGAALGWMAQRAITARPSELTGLRIARLGFWLSLFLLAAGWFGLAFAYATEVPDGFRRISYSELQPDRQVRGQIIPPSAEELNGQQVFIKGYMYPDAKTSGIQQFVLCRDRGSCCFGGNPVMTDRILVNLQGNLRASFTTKPVAVAGVFHVSNNAARQGLQVYYTLDATHIR
jgi:hypothetical protein